MSQLDLFAITESPQAEIQYQPKADIGVTLYPGDRILFRLSDDSMWSNYHGTEGKIYQQLSPRVYQCVAGDGQDLYLDVSSLRLLRDEPNSEPDENPETGENEEQNDDSRPPYEKPTLKRVYESFDVGDRVRCLHDEFFPESIGTILELNEATYHCIENPGKKKQKAIPYSQTLALIKFDYSPDPNTKPRYNMPKIEIDPDTVFVPPYEIRTVFLTKRLVRN